MRKLYIKQQVFTAIDKFTVKDENENDVYLVEGDFVQIGGKKLHIKDINGNELAMVQQKLLALLPKFFVFIKDEQAAEIKKKIALFGSKYEVVGPGWDVKGDFFGHDFTVKNGDEEVVSLHKAWLSWGDSYELEFASGVDEILALAVVLAVDIAIEQERESREASN